MKKIQIVVLLITFISLTLTAYQCASTEITSARLYIQQKNLDKAEEVLKKEVEKNPLSEEGWFLTGYVKHEKKDYKGMMDAFEKTLKIGNKYEADVKSFLKSSWAENFNSGVSYFNAANKSENKDSAKILRQKAINDFQVAILLQPDSGDTYKNLVYCYLGAGDVEGAVQPTEEWVKKTKALEGYQILGDIDYNKGEIAFNKYLSSKNPADSTNALEHYQKAIRTLEEGLKIYPGDGVLGSILFNAYIAVGRKDFALTRAEDAVMKHPDDKFANYNYATMLLEAKDYEKSVQYFKKALEIDPNYENAIYNLAAAYINWGVQVRDQEEASQVKERTYKKYFESALPYLERLAELTPDDYKIWERLGQVYANLGQAEKAAKAFEKADNLKK